MERTCGNRALESKQGADNALKNGTHAASSATPALDFVLQAPLRRSGAGGGAHAGGSDFEEVV